MHHTKIIATLGPATSSPEVIEALVGAGASVFRLNMSHGAHETHQRNIEAIREISHDIGRSLSILADIQGPKIRTGPLKNHEPFLLKDDSIVKLTSAQEEGEPGIITTNCQELIDDLTPGMSVLIGDGLLDLQMVERIDHQTVTCKVIQGGMLDERKGLNVPQASLNLSALTEKDRLDVIFAVNAGVDYIALSFVRNARDILDLRELVATQCPGKTCPPVVAKIEKPQAVDAIDEILAVSEALLVARGDLGVEFPMERLPVLQKQLIQKALVSEKPVIIATQMLDSMVHNIQPTRAEVTDVANAVFDGADAMMLSAETAIGDHPSQTVAMMKKVILEAEAHYDQFQRMVMHHEASTIPSPTYYHAIAHAACYTAEKVQAKAIVVFSTSGTMAKRISKLKPLCKIIALTPNQAIYQQLSLLWGIRPILIPFGENTDETLKLGEVAILANGFLQPGETMVFCSGKTPLMGTTNMLKVYEIGKTLHI